MLITHRRLQMAETRYHLKKTTFCYFLFFLFHSNFVFYFEGVTGRFTFDDGLRIANKTYCIIHVLALGHFCMIQTFKMVIYE